MSVGDRIKNMVAASPETVARVACGQSMDTPECFEKLLMGVLPAAYSSNNTNDTGGYTHISLAQVRQGVGTGQQYADVQSQLLIPAPAAAVATATASMIDAQASVIAKDLSPQQCMHG